MEKEVETLATKLAGHKLMIRKNNVAEICQTTTTGCKVRNLTVKKGYCLIELRMFSPKRT